MSTGTAKPALPAGVGRVMRSRDPRPADRSPTPLAMHGRVIEGHRVIRMIARGGMSDVYLARSLIDGALVAIKIERISIDPESLRGQRFLREIEIHRDLASRFVPRFISSGSLQGRAYLMMEYLPGMDLFTCIQFAGPTRRIGHQKAIRMARKAFEAIADIARCGVVHRDVKPGNLLLLTSGEIRLCDFGIARRIDEGSITGDQYAVGTSGYMSPEQWSCHDPDTRSDIYAMGIVLLEMLTGLGPTTRQHNHIAVQPDFAVREDLWAPTLRGVPREVIPFLGKCLHPDPRQRFSDASEAARELRELERRRTIGVRNRIRMRALGRRRWGAMGWGISLRSLVVVVLVVLVLLGTVVVVRWLS